MPTCACTTTAAIHRPLCTIGLAVFLIAISACPTSARGQNSTQSIAACPTATDMDHQHLQGLWRAELPGIAPGAPPTSAMLQLGPHPELGQSVKGTVQRGGVTAQVSGDVDGGELTLEESINGTNISATWIGQVVDGSCGKEIRGTWNNAHPTPTTPSAPFVLRKQAAWQ